MRTRNEMEFDTRDASIGGSGLGKSFYRRGCVDWIGHRMRWGTDR